MCIQLGRCENPVLQCPKMTPDSRALFKAHGCDNSQLIFTRATRQGLWGRGGGVRGDGEGSIVMIERAGLNHLLLLDAFDAEGAVRHPGLVVL